MSKPVQPSPLSMKTVWLLVNIFWYLGLLTAGLVLVLGVIINVTDFHINSILIPVTVEFEDGGTRNIGSIGSDGSSVIIAGFRDLIVETDSLEHHYRDAVVMPGLLILGYLLIVFQVRKFIRIVRAGRPFDEENPGRIRTIGFMVAIAGPIYGLTELLFASLYLSQIDIPGATVTAEFGAHPFVIFLGLIIIVIASVFDVGVRLRQEQDMTI